MAKLSSGDSFINQSVLRWKRAWLMPQFRWSLMIGCSLLILLGYFLQSFFAYIQARPGFVLNDLILNWLPPKDVSIPILFCIYLPLLYLILEAIQYPGVMWKFVIGFTMIHLLRIIALLLLPLETPQGFIPIYDPLQEIFYGGAIISKDLFFSGHTAMVFWIYFSIQRGIAKKILLMGNLLLIFLLLIQHIHYTIDIIAALMITVILHHVFLRTKSFPLTNLTRADDESNSYL